MRYLTFSEEDEKLGMICTDAGYTKVKPYAVYPPNINAHPEVYRQVAVGRILQEFQIAFIAQGKGLFETGDTIYKVNPGSVLLMLPGKKHRAKPVLETGWDEYWVGFKGPFFDGLLEKEVLSEKQPFFELGFNNHILTIYDSIYDEIAAQKPLFQIKACASVLSLIAEILSSERRRNQPTHYQIIVEKAKMLMESNIYGAINLHFISERIGISSSKLNSVFKTYTSLTPYQYYIHIKIHKAKALLEEGISVKETAFRMGFDDQYHFSRLFKHKTGLSPSQWK